MTISDHLVIAAFTFLQGGVFTAELVCLKRPADHHQQLIGIERFLDKIVGAQPGGFHGGLDRAVPGHHNHRTG